ncbi:uncharacterized protein LOC123704312 [Colias croceus]|uniref:uncharacterized protein LOC123704312 n=1 Tax=Colias crocea TaxID=72248 RepID=UPI001E27EDDA|nr:uncharacterized protein LOC123704312 [Colias croceus]
MGTTTDVTQQLLKEMNYPILDKEEPSQPYKPSKKNKKSKTHYRNKTACSDLRIAELGASTEIAHIALRRRSAVPIIIKSESEMKPIGSKSMSMLNRDSDSCNPSKDEWSNSEYSSKDMINRRWLDRRIGSIIKMPYKCFKKNILDVSSRVSVRVSSGGDKSCFLKMVKAMFHEEIANHQRHGLKKLFSTINRKNTPYKLGW